jgi:antitoxin component of RelBE/YafQ-DinJ toxin-antitoxin module
MASTDTQDSNTGNKTSGSKVRHLRVPDIIWGAANAKAEDQGFRMSDVIRVLLHRYANGEIDI